MMKTQYIVYIVNVMATQYILFDCWRRVYHTAPSAIAHVALHCHAVSFLHRSSFRCQSFRLIIYISNVYFHIRKRYYIETSTLSPSCHNRFDNMLLNSTT